MLLQHTSLPTTRYLNQQATRPFATSLALCLPRAKPGKDKRKGKLAAITERDDPQPKKPEKPREKPQHLTSLLDLQTRLDQSLKRGAAFAKGRATTKARELIEGSKDHYDLESFLAFAERNRLNTESPVYKGTHYEYTVMESLKSFGFHLQRSGKSNDKGIDLLGHWNLPGEPSQMKVLIQCKVSRANPSTVREMEGAYAGAPSEWQGDNVLALVASSKAMTKGAVEGVQRSPSPLGALHIDTDGIARQFIWNTIAGERGLAGVGVTLKYLETQTRNSLAPKGTTEVLKTVSLTWNGKPLVPQKEIQ
ncbi:hypothetical protein Q7P37_011512 [Cladosporium fusiforme]